MGKEIIYKRVHRLTLIELDFHNTGLKVVVGMDSVPEWKRSCSGLKEAVNCCYHIWLKKAS